MNLLMFGVIIFGIIYNVTPNRLISVCAAHGHFFDGGGFCVGALERSFAMSFIREFGTPLPSATALIISVKVLLIGGIIFCGRLIRFLALMIPLLAGLIRRQVSAHD